MNPLWCCTGPVGPGRCAQGVLRSICRLVPVQHHDVHRLNGTDLMAGTARSAREPDLCRSYRSTGRHGFWAPDALEEFAHSLVIPKPQSGSTLR